MTPLITDFGSGTLLLGDCRDGLRWMKEQGIKAQMCVTSPPYYGLRDYGTAQWDGGDPECDHKIPFNRDLGKNCTSRLNLAKDATRAQSNIGQHQPNYSVSCRKCGAVRVDNQIGLEGTPEAFVANLVQVFRLVRDVLADDGVIWVNLGDSYAGSGINDGTKNPGLSKAAFRDGSCVRQVPQTKNPNAKLPEFGPNRKPLAGYKPKDLIGIPWRVAFALHADGWWLRSDIIWHKPSCMPESVTDRPTRSHEYIFLLAKSQKYFYDNEAIKEPSAYPDDDRKNRSFDHHKHTEKANYMAAGKQAYPMRNKRSVWSVSNIGYSEAHFACYPPDLIKPCILAGSRPGDLILDPFMGSGTTAMVAEQLGRHWIGCELQNSYVALIKKRLQQPYLDLSYGNK